MLKVKQNSKWWQRIYLIFIQFLFLIHKQIKAIKWFELVYRGALWLFLCFWASEKSDFWYEEQRSVCVGGWGWGGGISFAAVFQTLTFMCHDLTQRLLLWRIRADCRPVYMFVNTHTHTHLHAETWPKTRTGPCVRSLSCSGQELLC